MRKTNGLPSFSKKQKKAPEFAFLKALVLCAAFVLTGPQQAAATRQLEGTLNRVIDGNTVVVNVAGNAVKIKLAGIDAPELQQPFGAEARDFLTQLLQDKKISVHVAGPLRTQPFSGELYFLEGVMRSVNREMIRNGMAWSRNRSTAALESLARRHKLGVWTHSDPLEPWLFREQEAQKRQATLELERNKKEAVFEQNFLINYYRDQNHGLGSSASTGINADTITRIGSFNGIVWGSESNKYDNLQYVEENRANDQKLRRATYRMKNETMRIAGVNLKHVHYYFYADRFCAAEITYSSQQSYQSLNSAFKKRYGSNATVSGDYNLWILDEISISTDWNAVAQEGRAVIANIALMEQLGISSIAP